MIPHLSLFFGVLGLVTAPPAGDQPYAVREIGNLAYYRGKDADPVHHRLDLYLPESKKDFPVLVLVHGGAWMLGDKSFFGWGKDLGRYFASRGIGVVMPSYRLSPSVKHPEHVKDVARAVAWTYRHIACYGGDPKELFLCGHSAGGHLVALLASDPRYLRAEKMSLKDIKGVIAVSGVYRVPPLDLGLDLTGFSVRALNAVAGLFGQSSRPAFPQAATGRRAQAGLPINLFSIVFGADAKVCAAASPRNHVRPGLPPFLLITAEHDLPFLPGMAHDFAQALRAARCDVQEMQIKDRDHEEVMFFASNYADPVARAIEDFVYRRCPR
jgi:acetyl esterase/lipase